MIVRIDGKRAYLDLWVMSCRVFKRGVEYSMLNCIIERLKNMGIKELIGIYIPTAKNVILKDFYTDVGFNNVDSDKKIYSINVETYVINENSYIENRYE